MKIVERIVIVILLLALFGGVAWLYFSIKAEQQAVRDAVARGEYEIPKPNSITMPSEATSTPSASETENWRKYYPTVTPVLIGSTTVLASVADTLPQRIKGLSDTPFLPEGMVKLFAFGVPGEHSIWMKDMNYSLDIIWVAEKGEIVHIEENVSPDTYPKSFSTPTPAFFVIEANAGFVASSSISLGDMVIVPSR
jgi:uncharacterized membrane protein (UPF0127 family)